MHLSCTVVFLALTSSVIISQLEVGTSNKTEWGVGYLLPERCNWARGDFPDPLTSWLPIKSCREVALAACWRRRENFFWIPAEISILSSLASKAPASVPSFSWPTASHPHHIQGDLFHPCLAGFAGAASAATMPRPFATLTHQAVPSSEI